MSGTHCEPLLYLNNEKRKATSLMLTTNGTLCEPLLCRQKKRVSRSPDTHHFPYARSTFPDLRQEVQTYIFLAAPLTLTLTDFTLDFHILLDLLWEWLTAIPKWAPLSHIEHFAIESTSLGFNIRLKWPYKHIYSIRIWVIMQEKFSWQLQKWYSSQVAWRRTCSPPGNCELYNKNSACDT